MVWVFVDEKGNDFFGIIFLDKFTAEEYARRRSCVGRAIEKELKELV